MTCSQCSTGCKLRSEWSFTVTCWHQLSRNQQEQLQACCQSARAVRLSLEWEDALHPVLRTHWEGQQRRLAACPKGRLLWIEETPS